MGISLKYLLTYKHMFENWLRNEVTNRFLSEVILQNVIIKKIIK